MARLGSLSYWLPLPSLGMSFDPSHLSLGERPRLANAHGVAGTSEVAL